MARPKSYMLPTGSIKSRREFTAEDGIDLSRFDPNSFGPFFKKGDKKQANKALAKELERLHQLQEKFYVDGRFALLIVLQGMDASGKDGIINDVITAFNPQGCRVESFKKPTDEEAAHDFLWREHKVMPKKGQIAVFNRSYYEQILVNGALKLLPKATLNDLYHQINDFERMAVENGTIILKIFPNISKSEQRQRLQERLDNVLKHWKFNQNDLDARKKWADYMKMYGFILARTNTPWAPWHIVSANRNWVRNHLVARILREKLESLNLKFPDPIKHPEKIKIQ